MTNEKLNGYLCHYVQADKTHSAVMLTGGWGVGKSYYIKNELIPFLSKEENGNVQCIIVSLYGLTKLSDISKSIFLESHIKKFFHENSTPIALTAKTIIKGISSFLGVDLKMTEDELKKLYESIDLSGKLIIFEDLERSQIDIHEILGYVNNLVEQDGVKVLLVANEKELIHYTSQTQENDNTVPNRNSHTLDVKYSQYTDSTEKYLTIKEKTISDTLVFEGDLTGALKNIMCGFDNPILTKFADEQTITELKLLFPPQSTINLRSFTYACQKTVDLFHCLDSETAASDDFTKAIFLGILGFVQRIKNGRRPQWTGAQSFSAELGSREYPLFRFCYDYITYQSFDTRSIRTAKNDLDNLHLYSHQSKIRNDTDLQTLYNYPCETENAVCIAMKHIVEKLHNPTYYPLQEYGRIAIHFVIIHHILDYNIDEAKSLLIKNLSNQSENIRAEYLFAFTPNDLFESTDEIDEFIELRKQMIESLNAKDRTPFEFDYQPSSVERLLHSVTDNEGYIIRDGAFAIQLDMDKVVEMLKGCTSGQLQMFRCIFQELYSAGNISDFLDGDKSSIDTLYNQVQGLKEYSGYDKIQKKQIMWFEKSLQDILNRL